MMNGDVFVDSTARGLVDKWVDNDANSTVAMVFGTSCYSLFVDVKNALYCAMGDVHQIGKQTNTSDLYTVIIVAGNGTNGTDPHLLHRPSGIFVDTNFVLYVADTSNHRVQKFLPGQMNGTTVAGNGAPGTIVLASPHAVFLDGNSYLFIAELDGRRIVGSGPQGFRCIAACSGSSGSGADQLKSPLMLSFNSLGSLFVMDRDNARIQEFRLARNSCDEYETSTEEVSTLVVTTAGLVSTEQSMFSRLFRKLVQ